MTIGKAGTRYVQNGHKKERACSVLQEVIRIRVECANWRIPIVILFRWRQANVSLVTKDTPLKMENVSRIQTR